MKLKLVSESRACDIRVKPASKISKMHSHIAQIGKTTLLRFLTHKDMLQFSLADFSVESAKSAHV